MKIEPYWWERAKCRDADPKDFESKPLPGGRRRRDADGKHRRRDWSAAMAICAECPVRESCFWDAMQATSTLVATDELFRAGLTPDELRVKRQAWQRMSRRVS